MKTCAVVLFAMALAACGSDTSRDGVSAKTPVPAVAALMQAQAPPGAIDVVAAKTAGPADKVAVRGRLAQMTAGRAMFQLMDAGLTYCGEKNVEDCPHPWDYCCHSSDEQTAHKIVVEARGADGMPLPTPSLGDLRLLDLVVVSGKLTKDEHGNFVLLATGWHRESRPTLRAGLDWPPM